MSALEKELHPLDIALSCAINGQPELSEDILRAQDPEDPRVLFNLGWHDMRHGQLKKGFEGMNVGRYIKVFGSDLRGVDAVHTNLNAVEVLHSLIDHEGHGVSVINRNNLCFVVI